MTMGMPRSHRGFTLTEVVVVLTILGILAAFAAPAMTRMLAAQRIRSTSYDLFADLTYARSQAIALGHQISVQSTSGNTNWVSGWQVWDQSASPTAQLRSASAVTSGVNFTASQVAVVFDRTGRTTSSGTVSFNIVPTDTGAPSNMQRCVTLDPSGRPRSVEGACP